LREEKLLDQDSNACRRGSSGFHPANSYHAFVDDNDGSIDNHGRRGTAGDVAATERAAAVSRMPSEP